MLLHANSVKDLVSPLTDHFSYSFTVNLLASLLKELPDYSPIKDKTYHKK